jgi:hypothetical protein
MRHQQILAERNKLIGLWLEGSNAWDWEYRPEIHERWLLDKVRSFLRPGRVTLRKGHVARPWRAAILRDAPLLKGFFAQHPDLKPRVLKWTEKVIAKAESHGN